MTVTILPGKATGQVKAPPSKSVAHRMMIAAGLSAGTSLITGVSSSQDMLATADCLSALGAEVTKTGETLAVNGGIAPTGAPFACRESGSTLRFFLPVALVKGGTRVFTGTPRLLERGVSVYRELLTHRGITFHDGADGLAVSGALTPGEYAVPGNVSSQFVSGLMFALPLLPEDSVLQILPPVESRPYLSITADVLQRFGICMQQQGDRYLIPGGQHYTPGRFTVEGDWSNAAFLLALNTLGGKVSVTGLNPNSLQGDKQCTALFARLMQGDPTPVDLSGCPDLGPVLFALAAAGTGGSFTGTRRLKIKESDRASAMAQELEKLGIRVTVNENSVTVHPGRLTAPQTPLWGHNDHRIVMALSLLLTRVGGQLTGAEAVEKSYPEFFRDLQHLGLEVTYET